MDIFAIGDIHGCAMQLDALLNTMPIAAGDYVVFLGDYVDIGPDSRLVIERLIRWRDTHPRSVFLLGNHELALAHYLRDGDLVAYAKLSGLATLHSYLPDPPTNLHAGIVEVLPGTHLDFFFALRTYWEHESVLFSHAGLDPRNPADRGLANMVLKSHLNIFGDYRQFFGLVICGHYFSPTKAIRVTENAVCIDTGCGVLGGPLSGLSLRTMTAYRADRNGAVDSERLMLAPRARPIAARLLERLRLDPILPPPPSESQGGVFRKALEG